MNPFNILYNEDDEIEYINYNEIDEITHKIKMEEEYIVSHLNLDDDQDAVWYLIVNKGINELKNHLKCLQSLEKPETLNVQKHNVYIDKDREEIQSIIKELEINFESEENYLHTLNLEDEHDKYRFEIVTQEMKNLKSNINQAKQVLVQREDVQLDIPITKNTFDKPRTKLNCCNAKLQLLNSLNMCKARYECLEAPKRLYCRCFKFDIHKQIQNQFCANHIYYGECTTSGCKRNHQSELKGIANTYDNLQIELSKVKKEINNMKNIEITL